MISVIVPVYNVEPYLRKCLDSIVNQTYSDLEILVIDDGSTDGCGKICDEYVERDERVKVFHTENRGLSCARNLGLDEAKGEWIGFVDSDDWIEPDMYEALLKRAEETGADVVECGVYLEYQNKIEERKRKDSQYSGMESVRMLLRWELSDAVWDKLWKKECFSFTRFPEGRIFEEYATTYRLFLDANCISTIAGSKYHYLQRKGSLSNNHEMKNLVGYWLSHRERYEALYDQVDEETKPELMRFLATAASRTWAYYLDCPVKERETNNVIISEMNFFTKQHLPMFGDRKWHSSLRICVFFPHFLNRLSFGIAWFINRINRGFGVWKRTSKYELHG